MKQIWAPWRIEFLEGERESGCVFCNIVNSPDNKEKLVLWRGQHVFLVMNKYPYSNGHLLIVPNRHVGALESMIDEENLEMMRLAGRSIPILREALACEGINCGMNLGKTAGAGILDHIHLHIVPRWQGDSNFMPVLADTRCMPEYLSATFERLLPHFSKL